MGLLDSILAKNIRLIDYECITERGERNGRRLVSFGESNIGSKKCKWKNPELLMHFTKLG